MPTRRDLDTLDKISAAALAFFALIICAGIVGFTITLAGEIGLLIIPFAAAVAWIWRRFYRVVTRWMREEKI